jgi:transposase
VHDQTYPVEPPGDDDEHDCGWKQYAASIQGKVTTLEAELEALKRAVFGKKSERAPKAVKLPPPVPEQPTKAQTKQRRQDQKEARDAAIEITVVPVPVPAAERVCKGCKGTEFRRVGDKPSVVVDFVSAHFRKRIYRRETLVCECGALVSAAPPERIGDKTHYAPGFCAHVVVSKIRDHMPLYRMAKAFQSQGVPIARSTLNSLLHRAANELAPIYNAAQARVPAAHRVHADETSFREQGKDGKTFVWTFVTDELVFYRYAPSRSGETPRQVLGKSTGLLTVDQHSGYNTVSLPGGRVRGGCLAHARRRIFEARALPEAADALELIRKIYLIERHAKNEGILHTSEHLALRKREARPLFAQLLRWARKHRRGTEPGSLLGRATGYLVRHFRELGRFLHHAELRLDNNTAESALRPVALGRKNYLSFGSEEAGHNIAALYTLVATCELHKIDPVAYLTDVLVRVQSHPAKDVAELLPHRWQALRLPARA